MSTCSELLLSSGGAPGEEPAEPTIGCPLKILSTVRERRELYIRLAMRWELLFAFLRVVSALLCAMSAILLLARIGGFKPWSLDETLGACIALTAASMAIQLFDTYIAPSVRKALYRAAALLLSDAFDYLNGDTTTQATELGRWAEKQLALASTVCEPSGRLTVVIVQ